MSWEKRHFMFSISKQRHVTADLTGYCFGDCKIRVSRQRMSKLCRVFQQSGFARTKLRKSGWATASDPQVELTKYPEGEGIPPKEDGTDGPHKDSNSFPTYGDRPE